MTRPVRLQLSRGKGFNLQEHSRAINGLPAINVARPDNLGNRYRIGVHGTAEECVRKFRADWEHDLSNRIWRSFALKALDELRGNNLACWCALDAPCHADVLLELRIKNEIMSGRRAIFTQAEIRRACKAAPERPVEIIAADGTIIRLIPTEQMPPESQPLEPKREYRL